MHEKLWDGANKKFRIVPRAKLHREKHNKVSEGAMGAVCVLIFFYVYHHHHHHQLHYSQSPPRSANSKWNASWSERTACVPSWPIWASTMTFPVMYV